MREFDFVKETVKKLIYAIEQQQISTAKSEHPRRHLELKSDIHELLSSGGGAPNSVTG